MSDKVRVRMGLRAFAGKAIVGYEEIADAVGLEVTSIRNLVSAGKLHPGIKRGVYRADDERLRRWVVEKNKYGQGFRSDLYKYPTAWPAEHKEEKTA